MQWKKVGGPPGGCTFWAYHDGRLALCAHGCATPNTCPDGVMWLDGNRHARLTLEQGLLELPVISADTGKSGYTNCRSRLARFVVQITGLKVDVQGDGWMADAAEQYLEGVRAACGREPYLYRGNGALAPVVEEERDASDSLAS